MLGRGFKENNYEKNLNGIVDYWREDCIGSVGTVFGKDPRRNTIIIDSIDPTIFGQTLPKNKNLYIITTAYASQIRGEKSKSQSSQTERDRRQLPSTGRSLPMPSTQAPTSEETNTRRGSKRPLSASFSSLEQRAPIRRRTNTGFISFNQDRPEYCPNCRFPTITVLGNIICSRSMENSDRICNWPYE